ncbi:hypothetical protein ACSBR1_034014 [Camellia fascicularis]
MIFFCCVSSCIATLLGAEVILTDLADRLRMLRKNVGTNLYGNVRGSTAVNQLIWGEEPIVELIRPLADYVTTVMAIVINFPWNQY